MNISIDEIKSFGCFETAETGIADTVSGIDGRGSSLFYLLVMLVLNRLNGGDICVALDDMAGMNISDCFWLPASSEIPSITFPALDKIIECLKGSRTVGAEGDYLPLILDRSNRLYLHKMHCYETRLAENLLEMSGGRSGPDHLKAMSGSLIRLFPRADNETDWQAVAACSAMMNGVSVITGGPGTGKTSAVVRILALLIESYLASGTSPMIALAAPTGKAAARLAESVISSMYALRADNRVKELIPTGTFTIHRLLGPVRDSADFIHNRENPLPYDAVVVDECSMVDLSLMHRLVMAMKSGSRLILLGDRDQLASVEGGAVFGDLCGPQVDKLHTEEFADAVKTVLGYDLPHDTRGRSLTSAMPVSVTVLRKNFRFGEGSGIGILAGCIRRGDAEGALSVLDSVDYPDVRLADGLPVNGIRDLYEEITERLIRTGDRSLGDTIFALTGSVCALTAVRLGPSGAESMNAMAETVLSRAGLINPVEEFYDGRPVIVSGNDYGLSIFNGDIGVVSRAETPVVVFPRAGGEPVSIRTSRMPKHETAFSITIHRSQGSEFDTVLVVLPDRRNRVLSRELLYTAVTRGKNEVIIIAGRDTVRGMVETPARRVSGLMERIWGDVRTSSRCSS